jgi:hypothetical protein
MTEKTKVFPVPHRSPPRPVLYPLPVALQIHFARVFDQHRFLKPRALLPAMVFHAPRQRFLRHLFVVPEPVKRRLLSPSIRFLHDCPRLPAHKFEQLRPLFPRHLSGKRLPVSNIFIFPPLDVISSGYSTIFVYKR